MYLVAKTGVTKWCMQVHHGKDGCACPPLGSVFVVAGISINLSRISLSVCLSVRLSVCLSGRLSVCLSVSFSVRMPAGPSLPLVRF